MMIRKEVFAEIDNDYNKHARNSRSEREGAKNGRTDSIIFLCFCFFFRNRLSFRLSPIALDERGV